MKHEMHRINTNMHFIASTDIRANILFFLYREKELRNPMPSRTDVEGLHQTAIEMALNIVDNDRYS